MKRQRSILARWILTLVVAGAGLAWSAFALRPRGTWTKPRLGTVYDSIYGVGTVRSDRVYKLRMGVQSRLARMLVEEGQQVAKGQALARFTEGNLALAPFAGQISEIHYGDGEMVFPNLPVLTLTEVSSRFVELALEQSGAIKIRAGQDARVSFEDLSKAPLPGKVVSLYPSNGQFLVRVEVPGLPESALVNMTADVAVVIGQRDGVMQAPVAAWDEGALRIRRGGKESRIKPGPGASDGAWMELPEGALEPGDEIFVPPARSGP